MTDQLSPLSFCISLFMAQMETAGLTLGWYDDFKEILARLFVAKPVMASLG